MTLLLSAAGLRGLEQAEASLRRPLTTVRRIAVAAGEPGVGTTTVARLLAAALAAHRSGRVLRRGADWAEHPLPPESAAVPPELAAVLRLDGAVWVGAPEAEDRWFDVAVADEGVRPVPELGFLADRHDALCFVVPVARARAEAVVAIAEQLTRAGRRVVLAFDQLRPGRAEWARSVAPLLASPSVRLRPDDALGRGGRPSSANGLAVARLAGHLMDDGGPR